MRKKLFALLLALVMAAGALPTAAWAAKTTVDSTMEQNTQSGAHPSNVESVLEEARQLMLEFLDDAYSNYVLDQSYYCKAVWKEINDIYKAERSRILKAKKSEQLNDEKTDEACSKLESLGKLTLQRVQGKEDLKRLQKELKDAFQTARKFFKRSNYNDYYWNLYQDREAEVSGIINKVVSKGSFAAYGEADYAISSLFPEEEDESDWILLLSEDDKDYDDEEESSPTDFLGQWLYTKSELSEIRKGLVKEVKSYVTKQLPTLGYQGSPKKFDGIISQFSKDLKKIPDAETMARAYETVLKTINKKAKITTEKKKTPPTYANIVRILDKMTDVYYTGYRQKDYTESGWGKLEHIYESALRDVFKITDAAKLNNSLVTRMKKKMDRVPKRKEELSKNRSKYIAKLKKLNNSKKYDPKKLKPILQKGIAAIKKCAEPDDISEIYWKYLEKAEKAIKTFKIVTRTRGKGSITRSGKVRYGESFTVRVSPKPGYRIKSVFVDGKRSKLRSKYEFENVRETHTITAVFK